MIMVYYYTFLRIACPVCGHEMEPTDLEYTGFSVNGPGYCESYSCDCGASFNVEVLIDGDTNIHCGDDD